MAPTRPSQWDNAVSEECPGGVSSPWDLDDCAGAWEMTLVHEIGHCLGLAHSGLTRKTIEPLRSTLYNDVGITIPAESGASSVMSYDRPGLIEVYWQASLNPYDVAQYLYAYSSDPDPLDDFFKAYGTVVRDTDDNDCSDGVQAREEVFGATVIALRETTTQNEFEPVHLSVAGIDPLDGGDFELLHLNRAFDYRILVVDGRDSNQAFTHGWNFLDVADAEPGIKVRRTDLWSESNSGPGYTHDMPPEFETGFDCALEAELSGPGTGDHDAGDICVEFDS